MERVQGGWRVGGSRSNLGVAAVYGGPAGLLLRQQNTIGLRNNTHVSGWAAWDLAPADLVSGRDLFLGLQRAPSCYVLAPQGL